jgi:hypothetical protein
MEDFRLFVEAELAALRQITVRLLAVGAIQAKHAGMDHDAFLTTIHDAVIRDIDSADFPGREEQDAAKIRERAKDRASTIITGASQRQ